jgi:hypothetical protein
VQLDPEATVHTSADGTMVPGTPVRSVTVIVFDCCEYTFSWLAVQPSGTHASTPVVAVVPLSFVPMLALGEFTA